MRSREVMCLCVLLHEVHGAAQVRVHGKRAHHHVARLTSKRHLCTLSITLSEVGFTVPEVRHAWKRGNAER